MARTFIVFCARRGQFIVDAATPVRAVQAVMAAAGGTADDWTVHALSGYPAHLQARLRADSVTL